MGFSIPHLLMVLAIAILVFGTRRLKDVGSDLGGAIKGFRQAIRESEANDDCERAGGEARNATVGEPHKNRA